METTRNVTLPPDTAKLQTKARTHPETPLWHFLPLHCQWHWSCRLIDDDIQHDTPRSHDTPRHDDTWPGRSKKTGWSLNSSSVTGGLNRATTRTWAWQDAKSRPCCAIFCKKDSQLVRVLAIQAYTSGNTASESDDVSRSVRQASEMLVSPWELSLLHITSTGCFVLGGLRSQTGMHHAWSESDDLLASRSSCAAVRQSHWRLQKPAQTWNRKS